MLHIDWSSFRCSRCDWKPDHSFAADEVAAHILTHEQVPPTITRDTAHSDLDKPHRRDTVDWLLSRGFIADGPLMGIAWSCRSGYDYTDLEFYPIDRHEYDTGWIAIVGHHASGSNPRLQIGTCENLADVQMVYETIRRINGYKKPEDDRGPDSQQQA